MCSERRASLEFLKKSGMQPHIIQLHDWHAAAAALLHWEIYHGQSSIWMVELFPSLLDLLEEISWQKTDLAECMGAVQDE